MWSLRQRAGPCQVLPMTLCLFWPLLEHGPHFWAWICALNQAMPPYSSLWDREVISGSVQWFNSSLLRDLAPRSLVNYTMVNEIPWWKTFWYHQKVIKVRPFSFGNLAWGFSGPAHGDWHRDEGCYPKRLLQHPSSLSGYFSSSLSISTLMKLLRGFTGSLSFPSRPYHV